MHPWFAEGPAFASRRLPRPAHRDDDTTAKVHRAVMGASFPEFGKGCSSSVCRLGAPSRNSERRPLGIPRTLVCDTPSSLHLRLNFWPALPSQSATVFPDSELLCASQPPERFRTALAVPWPLSANFSHLATHHSSLSPDRSPNPTGCRRPSLQPATPQGPCKYFLLISDY